MPLEHQTKAYEVSQDEGYVVDCDVICSDCYWELSETERESAELHQGESDNPQHCYNCGQLIASIPLTSEGAEYVLNAVTFPTPHSDREILKLWREEFSYIWDDLDHTLEDWPVEETLAMQFGKDLETLKAEPEAEFDSFFSIVPTVSAFHWLKERVQETTESVRLQHFYDEFAESEANKYEPHLRIMEDFVEKVSESHGSPFNTYNGEDWLDTILQYILFEYEGEWFVALQVHHGGDDRVNYGAPYFYYVGNSEYDAIYLLSDNAKAFVSCSECDAYWDLEPGYSGTYTSYHSEECEVPRSEEEINTTHNLFGEVESKTKTVVVQDLEKYETVEIEDKDFAKDKAHEVWEPGKLVMVDHYHGDYKSAILCPCCGNLLKPYAPQAYN